MSAIEAAARVDWLALSEQAQQTVREIAVFAWLGYESSEIAAALGISSQEVRRRLAKLRGEIREQLDQGKP